MKEYCNEEHEKQMTAKYTGTSRKRIIIEPEASTIDTAEIIEEESKRLQATFDKKQEQISKYPNTTLVLGVDLPVCLNIEFDGIVKNLKLYEDSFNHIRCVNVSGDHFWNFK